MSNSVGGSLGRDEAGEGREDVCPAAMLPVVVNHGREGDGAEIAALPQLSQGLVLG